MSQLIPVQQIDPNNEPIVDATRHNQAVRLAKGPYQLMRRWLTAPLILLFVLGPWIPLNGAPLLWMNLEDHTLHLFGLHFWPDDLLMLTWLALASAFALFIAANIAGRIWCGFTCPQTVWSMMFIWVEETFQGSRNKRIKQQALPFFKRNWKGIIITHVIWWIMAFITGFTFVAYFETGYGLSQALLNAEASIGVLFWVVFFTTLTYINAGWLREQVCLHMCPYARFQSVMVDDKTLKVSYDKNRGEPRQTGSGDCIDCQLCVQVCPVGIDIRQGLQYACIDCGACIDACDQIMDKIERPRGLIRFMSEQTSNKKLRPRMFGYLMAFIVAVGLFSTQVFFKEKFDASLNRERGQLYFYHQLDVANGYTLTLQNKTAQSQRYQLRLNQPTPLRIKDLSSISIAGGEKRSTPVTIICPSPCSIESKTQFSVILKASDGEQIVLNNQFFKPENNNQ